MSILVTGAPGWLGTTLVMRLGPSYDDVRCFAYVSEDTSDLQEYGVDVVTGDVRDFDAVDDAIDEDTETIFHCAGVNHPSVLNGVSQIHDINTNGTRNIVDAACASGVDHLVFVSSIMAQGFNPDPDALVTEDTPPNPKTEYGKSKLRSERYIERRCEEADLEYTILRPCWYYGPRQPPRMATLMKTIDSGYPIMFGDGTNLRSMTYVPSLADLMVDVMERPDVSTGSTYLVADQTPYTTMEIFETIARLLEGTDGIRPIRLREPVPTAMKYVQRALERADVHVKQIHVAWEMSRTIACDPSKAIDELGFTPPGSLESGMARAIEWAEANGQL